jgi:hypothetical protein
MAFVFPRIATISSLPGALTCAGNKWGFHFPSITSAAVRPPFDDPKHYRTLSIGLLLRRKIGRI